MFIDTLLSSYQARCHDEYIKRIAFSISIPIESLRH